MVEISPDELVNSLRLFINFSNGNVGVSTNLSD
jgi:hypothetical protein